MTRCGGASSSGSAPTTLELYEIAERVRKVGSLDNAVSVLRAALRGVSAPAPEGPRKELPGETLPAIQNIEATTGHRNPAVSDLLRDGLQRAAMILCETRGHRGNRPCSFCAGQIVEPYSAENLAALAVVRGVGSPQPAPEPLEDILVTDVLREGGAIIRQDLGAPQSAPDLCPECGGLAQHWGTCSRFVAPQPPREDT